MKKIIFAIFLALGLTLSSNATCVEEIEYSSLETNKIQPTSQTEVITVFDDASVEEESIVISHVTTFKGSASKVEVSFDEEEVGILY